MAKLIKFFLLFFLQNYVQSDATIILLKNEFLARVYSKVSIKRPVLLNDLVWIFPKSLY